jgi:hypothetical protein
VIKQETSRAKTIPITLLPVRRVVEPSTPMFAADATTIRRIVPRR